MLRWVVSRSLQLRPAVLVLAGLLLAYGFWTIRYRTPLDVFPEFAPPLVVVQTEAPGLSSEEVEALVTLPLEKALNGATWLALMKSTSQPGISLLELRFEEGTDIFRARQFVSERIAAEAARLPRRVRPPRILPVTSATSRLLMIGLTSKSLPLMDLRTLATWTLRPRLLAVRGVASVTVFGGEEKQYQVLVSPERLRRSAVTLEQVERAAAGAALAGGAGSLDTPAQRLPIQESCPITSARDIATVPVDQQDGRPLLLGEVAEVRVGPSLPVGLAVIGDPERGARSGVILIVDKQPWFNTLAVTRDLEQALLDLRPSFPPELDVQTGIFRQASFIERALQNLWAAMGIGCALVAGILFAFLAEWRTAVISLSAIPLSLVAGVLVLRQLGVEFNTMVLGGLAISIGEVVDDAIIDVENILRRLKLNGASPAPRPAAAVVLDASLEVRSAVVYASFIVSMVLLPVFFLEGVSGSFFRPLGIAYIAAVLSSLAVALTVTPALCLALLPCAGSARGQAPLASLLRRAYRAALPAVLRRPRLAAAAAILLAGCAAALAPPLWSRGEFLPDFRETNFVIHWIARPGTSLEEMERIGLQVCRQLIAVPGVRAVGQHIGRAEESEDVGDTNFGEIWIGLDGGAQDLTAAADSIEGVASSFPGIYHDRLTFLRERVIEVLGEGTAAPIVLRIYGPDLEVLRAKAAEAREAMLAVPGAVRVNVEPQRDVPQIRIDYRREALSRYGLTPGALQDSIQTLLSGIEVAQVYQEQKVFSLVVWGDPAVRGDLPAIGRLLVDTPSGARVPVSALADLAIVPAPNRIVRENGSRRIDVTCAAEGRGIGEVAADVARRAAQIRLPPGHHLELRGEQEALAAARRRIVALSFAGCLCIFLLLYLDFRSLADTGMILLSLPFSLAGGIFAAAAVGLGLGLGALVGLVTVFGIAARNGIMLLSHYRHLQEREGLPMGEELVLRGSEERLAPILMTSLATGLALLPFALGGGRPGYEIEHPMAVVILGGLLSSTALNLLLLPLLYRRFGRGLHDAPDAG